MLGVGGGLGAGYILWEFDVLPFRARVLTLGFRRLWQYPDRWARETAERLGLHAEMHETGGAKAAAAALDAQLEKGLPAIVWADAYTLGHRGEPEWRDGYGGPPLIVYERSGDSYAIDDRSSHRITVPAERLAAARARVGSYKHRLITIDPEQVDLDCARPSRGPAAAGRAPERAVGLVLAAGVAEVGPDDDGSRNKKGWPTVFADGLGVGSLRASTDADAAHGAHLRGLYADFLDEAAVLLERDALRDAAAAWRVAAARWEPIVDTALPPGDELRELIDAGAPGALGPSAPP